MGMVGLKYSVPVILLLVVWGLLPKRNPISLQLSQASSDDRSQVIEPPLPALPRKPAAESLPSVSPKETITNSQLPLPLEEQWSAVSTPTRLVYEDLKPSENSIFVLGEGNSEPSPELLAAWDDYRRKMYDAAGVTTAEIELLNAPPSKEEWLTEQKILDYIDAIRDTSPKTADAMYEAFRGVIQVRWDRKNRSILGDERLEYIEKARMAFMTEFYKATGREIGIGGW